MMKNIKKKITVTSLLMMTIFLCSNINAQDLDEFAKMLESADMKQLAKGKGEPNLDEAQDLSNIDDDELRDMTSLKKERINQMIKRQIEEIEHPHITQRPNNLDIKPRPTLMGEDADLDFFGYDLFIDAPLSFTPIPDMPAPTTITSKCS